MSFHPDCRKVYGNLSPKAFGVRAREKSSWGETSATYSTVFQIVTDKVFFLAVCFFQVSGLKKSLSVTVGNAVSCLLLPGSPLFSLRSAGLPWLSVSCVCMTNPGHLTVALRPVTNRAPGTVGRRDARQSAARSSPWPHRSRANGRQQRGKPPAGTEARRAFPASFPRRSPRDANPCIIMLRPGRVGAV